MVYKIYYLFLILISSLTFFTITDALEGLDKYAMMEFNEKVTAKKNALQKFNTLNPDTMTRYKDYERYRQEIKKLIPITGLVQTRQQDPLAVAVIYKDFPFIKYLLEKKANINFSKDGSKSALALFHEIKRDREKRDILDYSLKDVKKLTRIFARYFKL